jgi:biopolymer transport protein ExbD
MKTSRRIARMSRNRRKVPGLNLTSMMDVFTILLFFLMFHSGTSELLQEPKSVSLPDSVVESKPRETVVIVVGRDEVTVQGEVVARVADIQAMPGQEITPISERLAALRQNVIGISTQAVAESQEVTVLADKSVPFNVVKTIMSTCTGQGYSRISLAVIQKATETTST